MGMMLRRHRFVTVSEGVAKTSPEVVEETKKYTKSELTKMSVAELRELASKEGIENVDELNGTKLKDVLVDHFEL